MTISCTWACRFNLSIVFTECDEFIVMQWEAQCDGPGRNWVIGCLLDVIAWWLYCSELYKNGSSVTVIIIVNAQYLQSIFHTSENLLSQDMCQEPLKHCSICL